MGTRRVLVIEDEPLARDALVSLLDEEGFLVSSAGNGRDGIDKCRGFNPDVVVCDYYLPDVDGLEVLRTIRSTVDPAVRFIMVTAGLSDEKTEKALRAEADAFLGKPIDLDQLHLALQAGGPPAGGRLLKATS